MYAVIRIRYYASLLLFWLGGGLCTTSQVTAYNLVNITAAHCWYNPNCNGTIGASFNNETNCCRYGDFSYIKCSQAELKKLLMNMIPTKKLSSACVRCPPKAPKKPNVAVCTLSTCKKLNERCIVAQTSQGDTETLCLECDVLDKVCGTDNISYINECQMYHTSLKNDVSIAYNGNCAVNQTCAGIKCQINFTCKQTDSGPRCVQEQEFCGTDGVTYASAADMFLAACEKNTDILNVRAGRCNPNDIPVVVKASQRCLDKTVLVGRN